MELLEKEIYKRYIEIIQCNFKEIVPRHSSGDIQPRRVAFAELLDKYDVFCFDGYGTLYNRGDFVYPGSREMFAALRKAGKLVRLITNAASDVDRVLAADAAKRGFDFSEAETVSSGSLLKDLVNQLRATRKLNEVYYIGRETGKNVLAQSGITAVAPDAYPEEPVVAISSAKDTPETYARAVEILRRPGAILLVLNSDAWAPKIDGSREPVSGALSERLRRDSICDVNDGKGCSTYYLGKPFPAIWEKLKTTIPAELFGGRTPRVVMLGDTLGTDILGARFVGFDSALLVGRNQPVQELEEDQEYLGVVPNFYIV